MVAVFEKVSISKTKNLLNSMIEKVGQDIVVRTTVEGTVNLIENKAIITPLRYKNKIYLEGVVEKIGYTDERHYLYIGPAELNFQGMSLNTYITSNGRQYVVKACESVRMGNEVLYIWAILQTKHTGDNTWVL